MIALPIEPIVPEIRRHLSERMNLVLEAPPGAGKTTRVPLVLRDEVWLGGKKILMLEPRRIAARAAARRMAETLGEAVGSTVGYRTRLDSRVGPNTRIEVMTEGILTRRLQNDPSLEGVGIVIFDEFHERTLHADLGLALAREAQEVLRPDLRILVMSATLKGEPVAALLGGAPSISSRGKSYPVETRYLDRPPDRGVAQEVFSTAMRALAEEPGSILAFLPGSGEIRRVEQLLRTAGLGEGVRIAPLYGNLSREAQDAAIRPPEPGIRKIVLATSIAETSLTIEGVSVIVDGGLMRVPRFDPRSGMTRLVTIPVSRASADQRRGRGGRTGPGVCYRLWTRESDSRLIPHTRAEILETDLAGLALELFRWGKTTPDALRWIDPPPQAAFAQARETLRRLGAVDEAGRITGHGREMSELPLHPRLSHMILRSLPLRLGGLACELAALLGERDIYREGGRERDSDLRQRIEALRGGTRSNLETGLDPAALRQAKDAADRLKRTLGIAASRGSAEKAGLLLAFAYPDRIGKLRPGSRGRYLLSGGRGAFFPEPEPLSASDFIVAAHLDGEGEARIFLAAPVGREDVEAHLAEEIQEIESVAWSRGLERVSAKREVRLGKVVLREEPLSGTEDRIISAMLAEIRRSGIDLLPWTRALRSWQARVMFLRRELGEGSGWPDLSDGALLSTLETWLSPYLSGVTGKDPLKRLDLSVPLYRCLDRRLHPLLETLAPTHLKVPSGSRIPLDYTAGGAPILAVRIQEMFGARDTPAVGGGRVKVLLHLLSPAGRPAQVTRDLAGFWSDSYHAVRKELKGRYPKHSWPDDPLRAVPTARVRR